MRGHLSHDQFTLYKMIYERFMASQMRPVEFETTIAGGPGGPYLFRAISTVVRFKGFLALYGEERAEDRDRRTAAARCPPAAPLALNDIAKPNSTSPSPPPRFTDATLVKALEDNGIGRPSTYAPIIDTIINRGYVVRLRSASSPRSGASSPPRC